MIMADRREVLQSVRNAGIALAAVIGARVWLGEQSAHAATDFEVSRSKDEWKQLLTPEQYRVLRESGTEPPYSSPLNNEKRTGTYRCAGCALPLYSSETKFESGTGWPSFWAAIEGSVTEVDDHVFFFKRTEIVCHRCGGHQGHVFEDGPKPTGLRYCMNGVALQFKPA